MNEDEARAGGLQVRNAPDDGKRPYYLRVTPTDRKVYFPLIDLIKRHGAKSWGLKLVDAQNAIYASEWDRAVSILVRLCKGKREKIPYEAREALQPIIAHCGRQGATKERKRNCERARP